MTQAESPSQARRAATDFDDAGRAGPFAECRRRILPAVLEAAAFDGFTDAALERAARATGATQAEIHAAFPRGIDDALAFWSAEADAAGAKAAAGARGGGAGVTASVRAGVKARLAYFAPDKEAARRAAAALALPFRASLGPRLAWRSADAIWRALGDKSTDFNFYSKRAILAGVITSTQARWLADDSPDESASDAFLDARLDNVMQFEKAKARLRDLDLDPAALIRAAARLRYPDRTGANGAAQGG